MTLGIPRLRELFMTASKSIKTPVMTLPLLPGKTKQDAEALANQMRRIRLAEASLSSFFSSKRSPGRLLLKFRRPARPTDSFSVCLGQELLLRL